MAARPARLACATALLLAACRAPEPPPATPARDWPPGELRSGGAPVAAALGPAEVHRYRLPLQKGFLLRLVVDQQRVDAAVVLEDPTGAPVLAADRLIEDHGPELVLAVAETAGIHTLVLRGWPAGGTGRYAARIEALRPASEADRRSASAYRLFTGAEALDGEEAMERRARSLAIWRELGETALEAEALERMARQCFLDGERQRAADLYREAADASARAGEPLWEAIARNGLGACLLPVGEAQEAAGQYTLAISLARRMGDRVNEAKALHGLGQAFQNQGELQQALDRYREALLRWPQGDRRRIKTLHQLGVLYTRYLGDERRGGELLQQAQDAWGPGEESDKAITSSQLGRLAYLHGRLDEARRFYEEALALQGKSGCSSAVILARLALAEEGQGARPAAEAHGAEAQRILGAEPCPRSEPTVRRLLADLAERRGDPAGAREGYRRAEALSAELGDRMGRAESLQGIARSERSLGDRPAALAASRRALAILEGVRPTVLSEDLRTSFFSAAREAFDFHVDLLLELGAAEEAWATAERARARALGDLLAEAGAGLRRDAASDLIARERALQRELNALESRRLRTNEANEERLRSLRQSIDERVSELESLRGELRRRSPRYASLVRPEPISLAAVRRDLLDPDTVLLEYRLGETASTVWAVTREAVTAFRLPPRQGLEALAREAASWTRSREGSGRNPPALCELSRMLLKPVSPYLGHRRLVIVADGALETLSFAALPVPADSAACPTAPALVDAHEIAYLPSAATLLTQRRLLAGRRPAAGWLAVVADPVYGPARRHLPASAQEARDLAAKVPAGKVFAATGAGASRQTVTSGSLAGFRILHFAVHGDLNAEQPLLSALALAERDSAGRPVRGLLPAHEIYDLDLPAELVVLSACETALGREVPGEGLVSGLPRAFLYAGATRVLVSLWEVEDESTRDLMVLFYRNLLDRHLPPAQALQEAQRTLRQSGLPPRQWAGFVLLGDWRPLPPFTE